MHFLAPFTDTVLTVDKLLGREAPVIVEENAVFDKLLGVTATLDEEPYQRVMAKIAARRKEEAHG